ncbi:hypothetical protein GW932_02940 [archaeon]|nr:hypothetical protein [archaeon]
MTLLEKIKLLYPNNNLNAISFMEVAFNYVLSNIPFSILKGHSSKVNITSDGVQVRFFYDNVVRGKRKCTQIENCFVELASYDESEHYRTSYNPGFYIENGLLKVLPAPTVKENAYFFTITIPTLNSNTLNTDITFGENILNCILLYTAFLISNNDLTVINHAELKSIISSISDSISIIISDINNVEIEKQIYTSSYTKPDDINVDVDIADFAETIETFNLSLSEFLKEIDFDITELAIPDIAFQDFEYDFSFNIPTEPIINLTEAEAHLANAQSTIGTLLSSDSLNASFWLSDEDPEMVNSAVSIASSHLAIAKTVLEKNSSSYNTYNQMINTQYGKLKLNIDKYISEIDAQVKNTSLKIQTYQSKLQSYVSKSNSNLQRVQAEIQISNDTLQKELSTKQFELTVFKSNLEKLLASLNLKFQKYQSDLGLYVQEKQIELQLYSSRIQENIQLVNANMSLIQIKSSQIQSLSLLFQSESANYQIAEKTSMQLYQRYIEQFNAIVGVVNEGREPTRDSRKG